MFTFVLRCIYSAALLTASYGGLKNWSRGPVSLKLITVLLLLGVITEALSISFHQLGVQTEGHHHIFSIVEIGLTLLIYRSSVNQVRTRDWLIALLLAGLIAVLNVWLLQPLSEKNSYVISFSGLLFCALGAHALYLTMIRDELHVLGNPKFWFWGLQLLDGFTSFLFWGMYNVAKGKYQDIFSVMDIVKVSFSVLIYCCLAYAMIILPKRTTTAA